MASSFSLEATGLPVSGAVVCGAEDGVAVGPVLPFAATAGATACGAVSSVVRMNCLLLPFRLSLLLLRQVWCGLCYSIIICGWLCWCRRRYWCGAGLFEPANSLVSGRLGLRKLSD